MAAYRILVMLALGSLALNACSGAPTTPTPLPSFGTPRAVMVTPDEGAEAAHQHESAHATSGNFAQSDPDLIRQVIQATARFHSTTQASRAGYGPTPCVAVPGLGAMGEHWVNPSLVDPIFDPLRPESLLYEPRADGKHTLVGVEYIVIDVGQDRPSFGDRAFDVGGAPIPASHWTLHLWLWRDNPNGLFAPFNPDVMCP